MKDERKCGKSREKYKACQSPKHVCGSGGQPVDGCRKDGGGSRRMSVIRTSACHLSSRRPSLNPSTGDNNRKKLMKNKTFKKVYFSFLPLFE